jgi:hypothetical protein
LGGTIINTATTDRFFQLYDRKILPEVNDKPLFSIPVYQNNGYTELTQFNIGRAGIGFDRGICWAFSTSAGSYQPAAVGDAVVTLVWV